LFSVMRLLIFLERKMPPFQAAFPISSFRFDTTDQDLSLTSIANDTFWSIDVRGSLKTLVFKADRGDRTLRPKMTNLGPYPDYRLAGTIDEGEIEHKLTW
jgi:hypothetical protein